MFLDVNHMKKDLRALQVTATGRVLCLASLVEEPSLPRPVSRVSNVGLNPDAVEFVPLLRLPWPDYLPALRCG